MIAIWLVSVRILFFVHGYITADLYFLMSPGILVLIVTLCLRHFPYADFAWRPRCKGLSGMIFLKRHSVLDIGLIVTSVMIFERKDERLLWDVFLSMLIALSSPRKAVMTKPLFKDGKIGS